MSALLCICYDNHSMSHVPSLCLCYCVAFLYGNYKLCHAMLLLFDPASSDVTKNHCGAPKSPDGVLCVPFLCYGTHSIKMDDGIFIFFTLIAFWQEMHVLVNDLWCALNTS